LISPATPNVKAALMVMQNRHAVAIGSLSELSRRREGSPWVDSWLRSLPRLLDLRGEIALRIGLLADVGGDWPLWVTDEMSDHRIGIARANKGHGDGEHRLRPRIVFLQRLPRSSRNDRFDPV